MMLSREPAQWAKVLLRFAFPGAPSPVDLCLGCARGYVGEQEGASPETATSCSACGKERR